MTIDVKSLVRDDDLSKEALQRFIDKFAVHAVMPLEKLIATMCDTDDLTDAEVREELAEQGIDLDAAMARFRPKLDDLMRARAVRLALAAVRDNPLPTDSTSPWSANAYLWSGEKRVPMNSLHVRAHIAAAVNAAPVLAAEVERLQGLLAAERQAATTIAAACLDTGLVPQGVSGTVGAVRAVCAQLEAARVAVKGWPGVEHSEFCRGWFVPGDDRSECTCGAWHHEKALVELRRAVGLEEGK